LGQNGAPRKVEGIDMMLEDIMRAKKYLEDIGNIMVNLFIYFFKP
jgi:hypothetical protein